MRALLAALLPICLLTARALDAQASEGVRAKQSIQNKLGMAIVSTIERPLHPVVKGVVPGGGLGAGVEYDVPSDGPWYATTHAVVTVRRYWSALVDAGYHGHRASVQTYARIRELPRLDFFGTGLQSDLAARTTFRLRDPVVGTVGRLRVTPWLDLGMRLEQLWPRVGHGAAAGLPSIEEQFDENSAAGLTRQPSFGRYEGSIDVVVPAAVGEAFYQGAKYRVSYAIFSDQRFDNYSFRRLDLEAQQRFALFGTLRRLTLHGWLSTAHTEAGHVVPFYLQRTLGGKAPLHSVHENLIGSDGTDATLRGFRNFRFRDRNLLLLQAEYRMPLWSAVDVTVFADAGKVTSRQSDLNLADLRRSYGFSLSMMRGPTTAARVDVGFGGGEGTRVFLRVGRDIIP